jgi:3-hydroxyisobutyrate dehydrogenase-like beta-hydroxyacid dehydrogenase
MNEFIPLVRVQAPVSGSKKPAIDGTLIFLCGGNEANFQEVHEALAVMGKASHLIGAVGAGARMKLVVNMVMGAQLCASSSTPTTTGLLQAMLPHLLCCLLGLKIQ